MDETLYIDLLNLLNAEGINRWVFIHDFLKSYYPDKGEYKIIDRITQIRYFLGDIEKDGYIQYQVEEIYDEKKPSFIPAGFTIAARITVQGFQFLNNVKRDESAIKINVAIIKNTKNQTIILIVTVAISAISLIISILNYVSKPPQQILELPKKPIGILITDTSLQSIDTFHQKKAKRILPKKP